MPRKTSRSKKRPPAKPAPQSQLPSLVEPLLFTHLRGCSRILVAGAGGGFDVYAGLPLASALWGLGKEVHLASLSFTQLALTQAKQPAPNLYEIRPVTEGPEEYFPERTLAQFLKGEGLPSTVYAFPRTGVRQLLSAYRALVEKLSIDAIVLVDGGTDILMFGDESGLGTPLEDMTSLAAVGQIRMAHRHVACLGFGIDAFHGVCHAHYLENVSALERDGAYHGAFSLSRNTREGEQYLRAVEHTERHHTAHPSIVSGSIAAALLGKFGDVPLSHRTKGSELFINPLMGIYFTFDLMGVCQRNQYLRRIVDAPSMVHVSAIIEEYRRDQKRRPARAIPH